MTNTNISKTTLIPLEKARWGLAITWFPSCGILFFIMVAQSIGGAYGDQLQRAWGWALPSFLPSLFLMVSVFAADALKPLSKNITYVRKNFYTLALSLSIFYIVLIFTSLAVQPFVIDAPDMVTARLALLDMSNIWLAPLQGLVVMSLGVLFFLKEGGGE